MDQTAIPFKEEPVRETGRSSSVIFHRKCFHLDNTDREVKRLILIVGTFMQAEAVGESFLMERVRQQEMETEYTVETVGTDTGPAEVQEVSIRWGRFTTRAGERESLGLYILKGSSISQGRSDGCILSSQFFEF